METKSPYDCCRCNYFTGETPVVNETQCPKFEQDKDDEEFIICSHLWVSNCKGFCEINFGG